MKQRTGLAALFLVGAVLVPAVDSTLAQEQENPPEIEESGRLTEDETEAPETGDPAEAIAPPIPEDPSDPGTVVICTDTDDKREAWSMLHAGVRFYRGNWSAELFAYNLTDEVVQYWGGAAENLAKGSMSMPRNYGFPVGRKFNL